MKIDVELNPHVKEFIERKNPRLIGLWWAMYWRLLLAVFGIGIALSILFWIFGMFVSGNK